MGPPVAATTRHRRRDCRSLCGRLYRWLRTSARSRAVPCRSQGEARSLWTESSSREDAAHRVWSVRECEPPRSRPRQAGDVRLPRVQALLRDPAGWQRLRARKEADSQADANQTSGDQGAAHGDPPRRDRRARQMARSGLAGLDGLLCCADERLSDLSIPPSHDRTLAWRADASKPKTSTYVDENEDDR